MMIDNIRNPFDGMYADYGEQGMETLANQGIVGFEDPIPTESANTFTELGQFVGQNVPGYTDLRGAKSTCN